MAKGGTMHTLTPYIERHLRQRVQRNEISAQTAADRRYHLSGVRRGWRIGAMWALASMVAWPSACIHPGRRLAGWQGDRQRLGLVEALGIRPASQVDRVHDARAGDLGAPLGTGRRLVDPVHVPGVGVDRGDDLVGSGLVGGQEALHLQSSSEACALPRDPDPKQWDVPGGRVRRGGHRDRRSDDQVSILSDHHQAPFVEVVGGQVAQGRLDLHRLANARSAPERPEVQGCERVAADPPNRDAH